MTAEVKDLPVEPEPEVDEDDDFDELEDIKAYLDEVDGHLWRFRVEGEVYEANLNIEGVYMLRWISTSPLTRMQLVPDLLKQVLGEEQHTRLINSGVPWVKLDAVLTRVIEKVQGPLPGKASSRRPRPSSARGSSSRTSGKKSKRTS